MYSKSLKQMELLGERLKLARLRRRYSMERLCLGAGISRPTLYKIERGDGTVTLGHYVKVLQVLGLLDDLSLIAKDDIVGRQLQDGSLHHLRKRASKNK